MADQWKVAMDEYLPLRDVVFNTLRHAILRGELVPGERLMEIRLADRLGVSRTPVREAIRKLELEGLVVMIPRRGAEVAKITEKDLQDVLEVRCSLEEFSVELACKKITSEQIQALKKSTEEFKECILNKDVTVIAQKDVEFHDIIFAATGNERLVQMISNFREQMYRYRIEYLKRPEVHRSVIAEHEEIIRNLENRDVETAKKNVKEHIIRQMQTVSQMIKEQ